MNAKVSPGTEAIKERNATLDGAGTQTAALTDVNAAVPARTTVETAGILGGMPP